MKEILMVFGGTSVIAIGISTFIGKIISNKIISKWQLENQKQLELLKGEISKNQNIMNSLMASFSSGHQSAQEKRIQAVDCIWDATIKTITFGDRINSIYSILTSDELKDVYISEDPRIKNLRTEIDRLDLEKFVENTKDSHVKVEKLRPFILPETYRLFLLLHTFTGRSIHLFKKDKGFQKITLWKDDNAILTALKVELSEEEISYAISLNINSFSTIVNIIESKILNNCNKTLSGELALDSSLEQAQKLAKVLEANKQD